MTSQHGGYESGVTQSDASLLPLSSGSNGPIASRQASSLRLYNLPSPNQSQLYRQFVTSQNNYSLPNPALTVCIVTIVLRSHLPSDPPPPPPPYGGRDPRDTL
ncbi:unnamed protein product [Arctogadus glacialis]